VHGAYRALERRGTHKENRSFKKHKTGKKLQAGDKCVSERQPKGSEGTQGRRIGARP